MEPASGVNNPANEQPDIEDNIADDAPLHAPPAVGAGGAGATSVNEATNRMNEEGLHEWLMVDGAARLHHELSGGGANPFGGMGGAVGGGQGRDAQFDLMTVLSQAPLTTFETRSVATAAR